MTARQRGLLYFFALGVCAATIVAVGVLSFLAYGLPGLRDLDGNYLASTGVVMIDLHRREEVLLAEDEQHARPIAVVQTGTEQILLRVRLEETLLSRRRDHEGELVVVTRAYDDPRREIDIARTVTQQQALQMLIDSEFSPRGTSWDDVLEARVPSRRLPGGTNEGGRVLVIEKRTTVLDPELDRPGLAYLHPDDLYELGVGITEYEFKGFFLIPTEEGFLYQPLHLTIDDSEPGRAPSIAQLSFEYYEWEIIHAAVHLFGQPGSYVDIQKAPALRPIAQWDGPANAWYYDEDGWVYFGMPLLPGEMTPLLMEHYGTAPGAELPDDELRYRLGVHYQHADMNLADVWARWNDNMPNGLAFNTISEQATELISGILG